jgi:hypothetical protein
MLVNMLNTTDSKHNGSRRRTLKEQERLLHAPMRDVGGC